METDKTILFIDDDPDMLEIGGIILKKAGYEYLAAYSTRLYDAENERV
jgi:DNA-binding NtrC family response regulator